MLRDALLRYEHYFTAKLISRWKAQYRRNASVWAGFEEFKSGFHTGLIAFAVVYMRHDEFPSLPETIVSIGIAGGILGSELGGWMNDKFGRLWSIWYADILLLFGLLLMAVAPYPWLFLVGRIIDGLGAGIVSVTAPLYLSETSPARIRQAFVWYKALLFAGGLFLAHYVNLALVIDTPGVDWRWLLFGMEAFLHVYQLLLLFQVETESPKWLYRMGKTEEAIKILKKLHPADQLDKEVEALKASLKADMIEQEEDSLVAQARRAWRKPIVCKALAAGIGLQVFQQLGGYSAVMYYAPSILEIAAAAATGASNNSTQVQVALSAVIFGLCCVFGALFVSPCSVDKYGRKTLMIMSMSGIAASFGGLSLVFSQSNNATTAMLLLPAVVFFLVLAFVSYSYGMETVPSIVNSELYPSRHRSICSRMARMASSITSLFVTQIFLSLIRALGPSNTFLSFAALSILGLLFIIWIVPETKGLTFHQVQIRLEAGNKPHLSDQRIKLLETLV